MLFFIVNESIILDIADINNIGPDILKFLLNSVLYTGVINDFLNILFKYTIFKI